MTPPNGAWPKGFERLSEPLPPSLSSSPFPFANTTVTPAATRTFSTFATADFGSNGPVSELQELFTTEIGGHLWAPHGSAGWRAIQSRLATAATSSSVGALPDAPMAAPGGPPGEGGPAGAV